MSVSANTQTIVRLGRIGLTAVLAVLVFIFDLSMPPGVGIGVPYMAFVVLGAWIDDRRVVFVLSGVATVLILLGFYFPQGSGPLMVAVADRALALVAVWVTALAIFERRGVQQSLIENERRIHGIMDNAADGIITISEAGLIESFNKSGEEMFGYEAAEVLGKKVSILMAGSDPMSSDDDLHRHLEAAHRGILGARPREVMGRRKDGSAFPIEVVMGAMTRGDERVFIGTFRDITERKRIEREAAEKKELLELVFENMAQGMVVIDSTQRVVAFNKKAEAYGSKPSGFLRLGMNREEILEKSVEVGHIDPASVQARLAGPSRGESFRREMARPDGRSFLYERNPLPNGGMIASYTDVTGLKRAQAEVTAQSVLLETTMDTMAQGVVVYDADERLISFNGQYEKLMGFPAGFLHSGIHLGEALQYQAESGQLGPGDPEELCRRRLERFRTGNERTGEQTFADGTTYIYHRKKLPGGGFVITFTDLTGQKKAEQQILAQAALLEATFQNMSQGIAVFDGDLKLVAFNPQFAENRGYPPDLLRLGMSREEILRFRAQKGDFGNGDPDSNVRSRMAIARTRTSVERTLADGRTCIFERTPMPDGGFFSTATDITDRKRAERELAAKSALLETTIETMAQGVVVYDTDERLISFNGQYEKLMGFPAGFLHSGIHLEEVLQHLAETDQFGLGDPKELCREMLERFRTGSEKIGERILADGTAYVYHRKVLPDGGFVTTFTDITGQKQAAQHIFAQATLLEATFQNMSQGVAVYDGDMRLAAFNPQFAEILDYPPDLLKLGMDREEVLRFRAQRGVLGDGDIESLVRSAIAKTMESKSSERTLANGRTFIHERTPMPDGGFISTATDITERKRAEGELAAKSHLLEATFENMTQGVVVFDDDWKLAAFNPQFAEILEYPPDFLKLGMGREDMLRFRAQRGDFGDCDIESLVKSLITKSTVSKSSENTLTSGRTYSYNRSAIPEGGFIATVSDITERKRAGDELAAQSRLLQTTVESMAQGFTVFDADFRLLHFNQHFASLFDFPPGFLRTGMQWEEIARYRAQQGQYGAAGDSDVAILEERFARAPDQRERTGERSLPNGTVYVYHRKSMPGGGFVTTYTDITDRKRARDELAAQTRLLEAIFENMTQGIAVYDHQDTVMAFNAHYAEILGLPPDFLRRGMNRRELIRYRAEQGHYGDADADALIAEKYSTAYEAESGERTLPDGTTYFYERTPLPDGGHISAVADVTEWREAEKKLHQAQKMEAVGQLTGGIAHDFNNLLAVNLGNLELAQEVLEQGGDVRQFIETAISATERGASLTSQLMAFSRRQALSPEVTDVRSLAAEFANFTRRVLSEAIDLKIETPDGLWPVFVDRSQLQSVILNLVVNARDAMPDGGRITLSGTNVTLSPGDVVGKEGLAPGPYVELSVADTGCGMTPEVMEHVFEPFFTTKGVGVGTGLGLSMVYGFVQQSEGYAAIESAPGRGTTVRILLPRREDENNDVAPAEDATDDAQGEIQAIRGKILLVEDDADVRAVTTAMLTSAGYDVVAVDDGPKALAVMAGAQRSDIELVLSDIVLGGPMDGIEVAETLKAQHPDLRIVFMTGYADLNAITNSDFIKGWGLIRKPFTKADLIRLIEDARASKAA